MLVAMTEGERGGCFLYIYNTILPSLTLYHTVEPRRPDLENQREGERLLFAKAVSTNA